MTENCGISLTPVDRKTDLDWQPKACCRTYIKASQLDAMNKSAAVSPEKKQGIQPGCPFGTN